MQNQNAKKKGWKIVKPIKKNPKKKDTNTPKKKELVIVRKPEIVSEAQPYILENEWIIV